MTDSAGIGVHVNIRIMTSSKVEAGTSRVGWGNCVLKAYLYQKEKHRKVFEILTF